MTQAGDPRHPGRCAAFWRFSLAFYARPAVAAALLGLQDRAGADVNLMLYALWLGVRSVLLDAAALAVAEASAAPLTSGIVLPLRRLRRGLGAGDGAVLRRRIAAAELAAEREVQLRLAALPQPAAKPAGDRLTVARANLALYLGERMAAAETAAAAALLHDALAALIRAPH
ncbi:MAG: TIGR02444 family protein [Thiohalocapsa sp.]